MCCYARQDKHWVTGPDGQRWENYVVLADAQPELEGKSTADLDQAASTGGCCAQPGRHHGRQHRGVRAGHGGRLLLSPTRDAPGPVPPPAGGPGRAPHPLPGPGAQPARGGRVACPRVLVELYRPIALGLVRGYAELATGAILPPTP